MSLFKKRSKVKELWGGKWQDSEWWKELCALFKKDTGGIIDKSDPEYDAQKIYLHWIKSYIQ